MIESAAMTIVVAWVGSAWKRRLVRVLAWRLVDVGSEICMTVIKDGAHQSITVSNRAARMK
jgi:hypothetical protein